MLREVENSYFFKKKLQKYDFLTDFDKIVSMNFYFLGWFLLDFLETVRIDQRRIALGSVSLKPLFWGKLGAGMSQK